MVKLIFFIFNIMSMSSVFAHEVFKKLDNKMLQSNSLVCVGLDPDIIKMPASLLEGDKKLEDKVFDFLTQVIEITDENACSYKIQKAFFDQFEQGHDLLRRVVAYIHENHPGTPVFIDCKIGDTDNTMKAYMQLLFDDIHADAVVINPYMGDDVLEPFLQDTNKAAIILVQTSNPNAKVVQELELANGKKLWEEMLELSVHRWNKNQNIIVVLSSNTDATDYALVREKIPQGMPILLAGIGLQGGNPVVLKQLLNADKRGVFVNSSRGILYPYPQNDPDWQKSVKKAVIELKQVLNDIRFGS